MLLGFLRLATNPAVFPRPLDVAQATTVLDGWLTHGDTRLVREKEEHWDVLRSLVAETAAGHLTTDAHLAALTVTHGAILVSCDHDFARFRQLRWESPLTAG